MLVIQIIILFTGFICLAVGANYLINGAAALAKKLGISPLIIGLTIISLGTSLPEIVVSLMASLRGNPNIAAGNAIGSNIANIGLIIGMTAMIIPLKIRSHLLKREFPMLFLVMLATGILMLDGTLSRIEGIILLFGLLSVVLWFIYQGLKRSWLKPIIETEYEKELREKISKPKAILQFIIGLLLLPISSHFIVESGAYVAHYFKISDFVIGISIFALGTSLPELATTLAGAKKKEYDMVIGNIIGSNICNLLAVLAIAAIINPITLQKAAFYRDFSIMLFFSALFYFFAFGITKQRREIITRLEGLILVIFYFVFLISLYFL